MAFLKNLDWKKVGIVALSGAAAVGAGLYAQKKFRSTPAALAAGAATAAVLPMVVFYAMDKLGFAGLVMENVGGLVMENVGALPSLRTRETSDYSNYRGLVMENVAGLYDYV